MANSSSLPANTSPLNRNIKIKFIFYICYA